MPYIDTLWSQVHPISACQLEWSLWVRDVEVKPAHPFVASFVASGLHAKVMTYTGLRSCEGVRLGNVYARYQAVQYR